MAPPPDGCALAPRVARGRVIHKHRCRASAFDAPDRDARSAAPPVAIWLVLLRRKGPGDDQSGAGAQVCVFDFDDQENNDPARAGVTVKALKTSASNTGIASRNTRFHCLDIMNSFSLYMRFTGNEKITLLGLSLTEKFAPTI